MSFAVYVLKNTPELRNQIESLGVKRSGDYHEDGELLEIWKHPYQIYYSPSHTPPEALRQSPFRDYQEISPEDIIPFLQLHLL